MKDKGVVFTAVTAYEEWEGDTKAMKEGRMTIPKTRFAVEFKQVVDKACSVSTVLKPVTFVLTRRFIYLFLAGGGTSSRSKMQLMMLESVNQMLLTGKVDVQWQRYWKPVRL